MSRFKYLECRKLLIKKTVNINLINKPKIYYIVIITKINYYFHSMPIIHALKNK